METSRKLHRVLKEGKEKNEVEIDNKLTQNQMSTLLMKRIF